MRALENNTPIEIRHPHATRPWQHVLEPLSGYVRLAVALHDGTAPTKSSWNFGPPENSVHEVHEVANVVATQWGSPSAVHIVADPTAMHESQLLQLNSTKANDVLRWNIRWAFDDTMQRTVGWYRNLHDGSRAIDLTDADVKAYLSA